MSIAIMSKVFYTDIPNLSYTEPKKGDKLTVSATTAKFVLLAIADSADDFGENSYNGYERLGTKTSLQRRSVMRAIKALIANKYLVCSGTTDYGTKNFKIMLDKLGETPTTRSKIGKPPTKDISDSRAYIGDSGADIGDSTSTDSSLSIPNHTLQETLLNQPISTAIGKTGDDMNKEEYLRSIEQSVMRGMIGDKNDYAKFPPDTVLWVSRFCELWNYKPPQISKDRAYWITSCRSLKDACGEFGLELLDEFHMIWEEAKNSHGGTVPFSFSDPNGLVKTIRGFAASKRRGDKYAFNYPREYKVEHQSRLDV
ncbi:MAG: hypothetical protein MUO26_04690 [Methanotrichaceae archaeon]|nr:hypothetical protein [Methanotrichaceae archaeon]